MSVLFSSLRARLVALVLIAALPAFGLILWASLDARQNERNHARDTAVNVTRSISAQETQVIQDGRQLLGVLASAPQVIAGDAATCQAYLAQARSLEPRYSGFVLVNLQGDVQCWDQDTSPNVNVADRAYFKRVLATNQFATGDYVVARNATSAPVLPLAYPVFDARGKLSGMVATGVTLDWLNAFSARIALPPNTTLAVIDPNGAVLARQPDTDASLGQSVAETPLGRAVLANSTGSGELQGLDGKQRLFAYQPFDSGANDAYVAVGISAASAYAGINRTLYRNLGLLAAVTMLALAAAWFVGDKLVATKVKALMRITERVAAGDLTARQGGPYGYGEIDRLARSIDEMSVNLQTRDSQRRHAEEELHRSVSDLEQRRADLARLNGDLQLRTSELAASNRELTERTAELARSNSELEQFAYVASHDLQEPLRMVGNYTQLLQRRYQGQLDADADEFIAYAVDGARRMQDLINELLAFSRVGTRGKEPAPVSAETVLDQTLINLGPSIEEANATVTHDPLPLVLADDVQLGQIFQNLIGNAVKFHDGTAPTIHVSAEPKDGQWVFSVQDNGIGIKPEYHERIFVIFQRLHGRDEYRGTGMGLAICKKIVERHGGRLWVESDEGRGATFYFTMPAVEAQRAAA